MSLPYSGKSLDVLENRLSDLERKLFGQETWANMIPTGQLPRTPCVTRLTDIAKESGTTLENRDRIAPLLRKLNELETVIAPSFGAEMSDLSADSKVDLILSNESRLRKMNQLLKSFHEKKNCLNSDAFMEVLTHEDKMVELAKIQADQDEQARELSENTFALIGHYNDIVETITNTFLSCDKALAEKESVL